MKRRIYLARRIASNTNPDVLLAIRPEMGVEEIAQAYAEKQIEHDGYIHNGHWILRPVVEGLELAPHAMPEALTPEHIREMVSHKINTSDAFVAFLNTEAFGAIAELGYAAGTKRIAVYVLPEPHLDRNAILELWLSFQIALETRDLWSEDDIHSVEEFAALGINSVAEYAAYIQSIIPAFLIK